MVTVDFAEHIQRPNVSVTIISITAKNNMTQEEYEKISDGLDELKDSIVRSFDLYIEYIKSLRGE